LSEEEEGRYERTQRELGNPDYVKKAKRKGFLSRQVSGIRQRISEAETKRTKEKALVAEARERGRTQGLVSGAEARGREEGQRAAKYGTGVSGFFRERMAPKTSTVRTTRYVGKGKHRHKVTTTRQVAQKSGSGGFGISFDPAGGMAEAYGQSKSKGKDEGGIGGFDLVSGWETQSTGRKKKADNPFDLDL
jgi:hypothetical protein